MQGAGPRVALPPPADAALPGDSCSAPHRTVQLCLRGALREPLRARAPQPRDTMSQTQPYTPRKSNSPAASARRNDSQDYLLLDADPCEESALPPYAFYPV